MARSVLRAGVNRVGVSDELWDRVEKIDGWLHREEADLLLRLVRGRWCELGCWKGRSTVVLGSSGYHGWAIDWFRGSPEHRGDTDTYEEFCSNIADFPNVEVIRARFDEAVRDVGRLRFLHLDGDHSYSGTEEAFNLYSPKVERGGYIVFHDAWGEDGQRKHTPWPEVTQFVQDLISDDDDWMHIADARRSAAFLRR